MSPRTVLARSIAQPSDAPLDRLWQYQRERFPLARHGPFVAVFAVSALCDSAALGGAQAPSPAALLGATTTALLGFLLMRVVDEWKDRERDAAFRPERPVPRGLVSLVELGAIGALAAIAQVAIAAPQGSAVLGTLALWWCWLGVTAAEFGVPRWLERRPLVTMVSHLPLVALLYLHTTAWEWGPRTGTPPAGLGLAVATSYAAGSLFELARKLRSPEDERPGVDTYTSAWGTTRAAASCVAATVATAILASVVAARMGTLSLTAASLGALSIATVAIAVAFARRPTAGRAKALAAIGSATTFATFAVLGVAALLRGGVR